ncbi:MAG: YkvA family protein [Bauldia sp.]
MKRDAHALYLAARDRRTPWYAKLLALVIAGYALSPIDLIPDFIPILGFIDDAINIPAGIWLVLRLIPPDLMVEFRGRAEATANRPVSRSAAIAIVAVWVASAVLIVWLVYRALRD